jgi:hypothetical protein
MYGQVGRYRGSECPARTRPPGWGGYPLVAENNSSHPRQRFRPLISGHHSVIQWVSTWRPLLICRQLHVWFSDGKGFAPDQIGEFTGIIINTVVGLFSVSPAKLENIVECLLEIRGLTTVSRRILGRGRGKTGRPTTRRRFLISLK